MTMKLVMNDADSVVVSLVVEQSPVSSLNWEVIDGVHHKHVLQRNLLLTFSGTKSGTESRYPCLRMKQLLPPDSLL